MQLSRRHLLQGAIVAGGLATGLGARPRDAHAGQTPAIRPRTPTRIVAPQADRVGDVFRVRRTIPAANLAQIDPFLMLDHFDFTLAPGELGGLAPHPHRGIETVTILVEGAIEHGDSLGNRARLEEGGVQWMTAASGIVHEENPDDSIRERGGRIHGLQLWVNLPARAKLAPPRYQDQTADRIPLVDEAGVRARVIAGEAHGVSAVIGTETPIALIDYAIEPGSEVALDYPDDWTAFVHVIDGTASVGGTLVPAAHLAVLGKTGSGASGIHLANPGKTRTRLVLGGGEPIAEPLARYGPFAMNTEAELRQAFEDYRAGRMGRVANPTYDRVRLR